MLLAAHVPANESIRYCLKGDMNRGGHFADSYLVVTDKSAIGLGEGQDPVTVELADIDSAKNVELFGGGRVMIKSAQGMVTLICYSHDLIPEFAAGARIIEEGERDAQGARPLRRGRVAPRRAPLAP